MSETPAETVKRAATLMRQRAEAASRGPWKSWIEGRDHWGGDSIIATEDRDPGSGDIYVNVGEGYHAKREADQDYIAGMHPLVGMAVAGWLESLDGIEWSEHHSYSDDLMYALKLACAYLPAGIPMWTHDLRQEHERRGFPVLPSMPGARGHNALDDAREVKYRYERLQAQAAPRTGLGKVQEAVRRSRGGDPPVQVRGFA